MLPEEFNTLVQSAKAGDANAAAQLNNIGWEYQFGNNGRTVDQALAYQLYAISAESGDFNGMNNAGYCISNGIGIEKDLNKAFEYFKQAAELGHWGGMSNLGWCYLYGNGIEKDVEKAIHWLTRAAEEGNNIWSMNRLTEIYGELDGYVNHEQAAKWFLTLIQKDCDPNSGVYEQTGYNKDLYEKVKNTILNSASESELSSLSGSSSGGSLFGGSISIASSNAKTYINQAEELLTKKNNAEKEKIISLIENDKDRFGEILPFQRPLGNFVIPEGTRRIGENVFSDETKLTSITIPNSVTSIGKGAFRGCSSLASIVIGRGVTSIGDWAFDECTSLTSVTICDGVKSIGKFAFAECNSLTSIHIPGSVTTFESAFMNCNGLTTVSIDGATSIGESAFGGCHSLTSVSFGDKVTNIGNQAFVGCEGLTSIIVPDSVESIGRFAFMNCESLAGVKLGKGIVSIGQDAFFNCPIQNIIVPKGTRQRFENMEGLKGLEDKIIEE